MNDPTETDVTGNTPSTNPTDTTGNRIFAAYGGIMALALVLVLAVVGLVWWLVLR